MAGGSSFRSTPCRPAAMVAAKARYGVASAPGVRFPPPKAAVLAADAKATRAVVPAPRDAGGREGAGLVALVGVDGRRVEVGELAGHRDLPGQPLPEERRALAGALGREQVPAARLVPHRGV